MKHFMLVERYAKRTGRLKRNGDTGSRTARPAAKTMMKQPQTILELMLCMSSFFLSAERMMEVEQALAFALGMPRQR